MDFQNQVAILTGASRNPGLAMSIAEALAARGAKLMLSGGSNQNVLDENVAALRAAGADVCGRIADVTDYAQTQTLVDAAASRFGRIDMLVHCAGGRGAASIVDMKPEDWQRVVRVNLDGAFNLTKAVAPHMIRARRGRLVFMSGISGQAGDAERAHVVTAKGGIIAFVKAAASDLGAYGITANAIAPGVIDTPRPGHGAGLAQRLKRAEASPLRRLGRREEIASACLFLLSDEASFITGQTLAVNGGSFM